MLLNHLGERLWRSVSRPAWVPRRSGEAPPDDDDDDEFARAPKTPKLAPKPDVDLDKARTALDEAERPGG